jgi:ABC-type multidrug transport system fused ATPase/permease subunit
MTSGFRPVAGVTDSLPSITSSGSGAIEAGVETMIELTRTAPAVGPKELSPSLQRAEHRAMPASVFGYVVRTSGPHQVWLALLSIAVFLLTMGPLELQRRIVNGTLESGAMHRVVLLCGSYAALALVSGGIKLALNVYRGWVSENAVRDLRRVVYDHAVEGLRDHDPDPEQEGIGMAIILTEAEPVGGFVGVSISEPLMQTGTLVTVFAYMIVLQPLIALFSLALFSLQIFFVPRLQHAVNLRAAARIRTMREVSGEMIGDLGPGLTGIEAQRLFAERIGHVFRLNMAIYWLKFTMNFLMNLTHHLGVIGVLLVGSWYVVQHQLEIGTVVAFISGLSRINEPWGELVNYYREMTVVGVKYRLIAGALEQSPP